MTTWDNAIQSKGFMIRDVILMEYKLLLVHRLAIREPFYTDLLG